MQQDDGISIARNLRGVSRRNDVKLHRRWLFHICLLVILTVLFEATVGRGQEPPTGLSLCADNVTFGYRNVSILKRDLGLIPDNGQPRIFVLCPSTTFQLSIDGPLIFNFTKSSINIVCGLSGKVSNQCILNGGNRQVVVRWGAVFFFGLTFQNSSEFSLLISSNATATFDECQWKRSLGVSSVLLTSSSRLMQMELLPNSHVDWLHARASLLDAEDMPNQTHNIFKAIPSTLSRGVNVSWTNNAEKMVSFRGCYFLYCSTTDALIVQEVGKLLVEDAEFYGNDATGSLVSSWGGKLAIIGSHFFKSSFPRQSPAFVSVSDAATLLTNDRNCGDLSTATCSGVAVRDPACVERRCAMKCLRFLNCSDMVEFVPRKRISRKDTVSSVNPVFSTPSTYLGKGNLPPGTFLSSNLISGSNSRNVPLIFERSGRRLKANNTANQGIVACPGNKSLTGYTDIGTLQHDILFGTHDTFILCPKIAFKSILIIQPPILSSNVTLKCADLGSTCAWRGGQQHLVVIGRAGPLLNVRIEGITFRNAKDVSTEIIRNPTTYASVEFVSCRWEGNRGSSSVWIKKLQSSSSVTRRTSSNTNALTLSGSRTTPHRRKPSGVGLSVTFTRCLFASHKGSSAVAVESPSISRRRLFTYARTRRLAPVDFANFDSCIFNRNTVNGSVIEAYYSSMSISDCLFASNEASKAGLINSVGGSLFLERVRVEYNIFNATFGVVSLKSQATLSMENVCAPNNTAIGGDSKGSCNGASILPDPKVCKGSNSSLPACRKVCRPFVCSKPTLAPSNQAIAHSAAPTKEETSIAPSISDAPSFVPSNLPSRPQNRSRVPSRTRSIAPSDSPSIVPSDAPSRAPSDIPSLSPSIAPESAPEFNNCSSTWQDLSTAIKSFQSSTETERGLFIICADSVLAAAKPIVIDKPSIIQCGDDGSFANNCKILGGSVQFDIAADRVHLSGLTLMGSTVASVWASGKSNNSVALRGCKWTSNSGVAAVLSYSGAIKVNATLQQIVETLATSSTKASMGLDLELCSFSQNALSWAPAVAFGGPVNLNVTYFVNNTSSIVGAVSAVNNSSLSVSSSCFIDNVSKLPGSIFVDNTSRLLRFGGNFGVNNTVGKKGQCTDIFQATSGSCLSSEQCKGRCSSYDSMKCEAPLLETSKESSFSPSLAPSRLPGSAESSQAPTAAIFSSKSLGSSGIFYQTLGASLFVLGGGAFAYFYMKKNAGKA